MGRVISFPKRGELPDNAPEGVIACEALLYSEDLRAIAESLEALEHMDAASEAFGAPIGTIIPFFSEAVHIGNLIKIDEEAWGYDWCMRPHSEFEEIESDESS